MLRGTSVPQEGLQEMRPSLFLDKKYSFLRLLTAASERHQIRTWQV